ncbi:MAG: hypothetical protein PHI12_12425 [Dehalococcoidales bacterium]|nr:hypothetical protein [Dehalococcoidales bacterium]
MRIAVYSSETIAERIRKSLHVTGVTVVPIIPGVFARHDIPSMDRLLDSDLIIMEAAAPDVDKICQHLKSSGYVPLVVLIDENHVDWERLCYCGALAYISLSAGEREFDLRINSVIKNISATPPEPSGGSTL